MQQLPPITKAEVKESIQKNLKTTYSKTIQTATQSQIYHALSLTIREYIADAWIKTQDHLAQNSPKTVYYLSMEFLMGRFMGNAMVNLSLDGVIGDVLADFNIDINTLEEREPDPGLGNGGLGRLAACFLDSLATLGYPAYGCGIRYHYGIFKQGIHNGHQVEMPDNWLENGDPWGVKHEEFSQEIKFGGNVEYILTPDGEYVFKLANYQPVMAVPYDYPVIGYNSTQINTLRLWDAKAINHFNLTTFNQGRYQEASQESTLANTITSVLYPADEHMEGKELRLRQQYFFISATVQWVVKEFAKKHPVTDLAKHVQFQLNDTHPSLAVPELMRVLIDDYQLDWDTAWEVTRNTCAYTNHTILSEALEKWPIGLFKPLLPRVYMIIEEIDRRFCENLSKWHGDDPQRINAMAICAQGEVRMAHLAIVGSHSVNGVAAIHTNILKNIVLKDFYDIYPKKFNNKTNGITPRRWLAKCNPGLSRLITQTIGDSWLTNLSQLSKLQSHATDPAFAQEFMAVKHQNKVALANHLLTQYGTQVDPGSIFDIQVKRLHEYKRQLLNVFQIIDMYNQIRQNPTMDMAPRTFIFAAKAAASYHRAKLIIKLINAVADTVNNDPIVKGRIKVLFLPNYCVTMAEKLVPACDVSQQISTAGKEASGTGNMKFMLNGAITIGTLDGANVEMLEELNNQHMFIFGLNAQEVHALNVSGNYNPWGIYNSNSDVAGVLTTLVDGTLDPDKNLFKEIYDAMLYGYGASHADEYYVLQDFAAYKQAQADVALAYQDKQKWAHMAIMNTACAGKFSSDRTIVEYAQEIWSM